MRKSIARITTRRISSSSVTKMVTHFPQKEKNAVQHQKPVQPNEETVDRLNDIGKTYPFCVYYRQQNNDPL